MTTELTLTPHGSSKPRSGWIAALWLLALAALLSFQAAQPILGLQLSSQPDRAGLQVRQVHHDSALADQLQPGQSVLALAANGSEVLLDRQLLQHPLSLPAQARDRFYNEQQQLSNLLLQQPLAAQGIDGSWRTLPLSPQARGAMPTLPVGLALLSTTAAVLAVMFGWHHCVIPKRRWLLLTLTAGLALLSTGLVLSQRELALPQAQWQLANGATLSGTGLTLFALLALLLRLPRPLGGRLIHTLVPVALSLATVALLAGWLPVEPLQQLLSLPLGCAVLLLVLLVQGWRSRGRPLDTAVWQWLALYLGLPALLLGTLMVWLPPSAEQQGWLPIALMASASWGMAKALRHWQLFRVAGVWQLTLVVLLLVALGLLILQWLHLTLQLPLRMAGLLTVLLLAPLAGLVTLWLRRRRHPSRQAVESSVLNWLARTPDSRLSAEAQWQSLLQDRFQPRLLHPAQQTTTALGRSGMNLMVPTLNGDLGYRLSGRNNGSRLFSMADVEIAARLHSVVRQLDNRGFFADSALQLNSPVTPPTLTQVTLRANPEDSFLAAQFDMPQDDALVLPDDDDLTHQAEQAQMQLPDNLIMDCREELQRYCEDHNIILGWPQPDTATRQATFPKDVATALAPLMQDLLFTLPILLQPDSIQVVCNHKAARFYLSLRLQEISAEQLYRSDITELRRELLSRTRAIAGNLLVDERTTASQQRTLAIVLILPLQ